jgi:hypothetical protein
LWVKCAQTIIIGTTWRCLRLLALDKEANNYFIGKLVNETSLREYLLGTKFNETCHSILIPISICGLILYVNSSDYPNIFLATVSFVLNWYCNILQRYNRARVEKVLNKRYPQ